MQSLQTQFKEEFDREIPRDATWDAAWDAMLGFRYSSSERFEKALGQSIGRIEKAVFG